MVSLAAGLVRVLLATLYMVAAAAILGVLALAVSTVTEHSLAAIVAVLIAVVTTSEVLDNTPQLGWLAPYVPTHWWGVVRRAAALRAGTVTVGKGLASFGIYA